MKFLRPAFLGAAVAVFATGCLSLKPAQDQERHYILAAAPAHRAETNRSRAVISLRPVDVARYLRGLDIAIRTGQNEITYPLNERWAEPLDDGIRRVLAEDLGASPAVREVLTEQPAPPGHPVYAIYVRVLACEGVWNTRGPGSIAFKAEWQIIQSGPPETIIDQGVFQDGVIAWTAGDYGQLASRLDGVLGHFADAIVAALARHGK
ncbi:MAG TPA: ABC-type transport auxiliary lipoprotein family protein [Verrucomicrobiae bacterium]|jgi:hypothetical protein